MVGGGPPCGVRAGRAVSPDQRFLGWIVGLSRVVVGVLLAVCTALGSFAQSVKGQLGRWDYQLSQFSRRGRRRFEEDALCSEGQVFGRLTLLETDTILYIWDNLLNKRYEIRMQGRKGRRKPAIDIITQLVYAYADGPSACIRVGKNDRQHFSRGAERRFANDQIWKQQALNLRAGCFRRQNYTGMWRLYADNEVKMTKDNRIRALLEHERKRLLPADSS